MALLKLAAHWLRYCSRAAKRFRYSYISCLHKSSSSRSLQVLSMGSRVSKISMKSREFYSLVCDFNGTLLRTSSSFPFFMLLAFEGGGLLRALLLLLSYPLVAAFGEHHGLSLRTMAFFSFCGLKKKDVELVARGVLPKFYLENMNAGAYEFWAAMQGRRAVVTGLPAVLIEWFSKEYLGADEVAGTDMQVVRLAGELFYTGLLAGGTPKFVKNLFGGSKPDVGLVSYGSPRDHLLVSCCKEAFLVDKNCRTLPPEKYPKPLIFHDGRLAFLPTPAAAVILFLWLPFGLILFTIRAAVGILLPYQLAKIVGPFIGFRFGVDGLPISGIREEGGVLFVCNHRTLLDPLVVSTAIGRPLTAVTYSLSPVSERLSPIKTARLTRDRRLDADKISELLKQGDVVVCPEGTTCREPYLLRFSSLFAELSDAMVLVAVNSGVSMFYGTTARGFKFLDPVFFLMNPRPEYAVRFLGRVPPEMTCAGGSSGTVVANRLQKQVADALGFECSMLTRRDKYLMLAGNEGIVEQKRKMS